MLAILKRETEYNNIKKPKSNKDAEGSTIGTLKVYDDKGENIFTCFTLENAGESIDTSKQDKRIVARDYKLEWTSTSVCLPKEYKWNGLLLTCDDVLADFRKRKIFIHVGNYPQDTAGCILLGMINKNDGAIYDSTNAVKQFYDIVKKYGADNFVLRIKEI